MKAIEVSSDEEGKKKAVKCDRSIQPNNSSHKAKNKIKHKTEDSFTHPPVVWFLFSECYYYTDAMGRPSPKQ